jgi:hypothetical protein
LFFSLQFLSLARQHGGPILRTAKVATIFLIFNRVGELFLADTIYHHAIAGTEVIYKLSEPEFLELKN